LSPALSNEKAVEIKMIPKSILRNSAAADDIASQPSNGGGGLLKFLSPFLRQKSTTFAPEAKRDFEDDRIDEAEERANLDGANDQRLNMSLTFVDKLIDDISMMLTFENDPNKADEALSMDTEQDNGLEITFENYEEYEELKKQRAADMAKDDESESVQATCVSTLPEDQMVEEQLTEDDLTASVAAKWSERDAERLDRLERELASLRMLKQVEQKELKTNRDKRKQIKEEGATKKLIKDMTYQHEEGEVVTTNLYSVQRELDELRKLKARVVQAKENAKVQRAVLELASFKKKDVPIAETVQKRLQSSLAIVQEYRSAQEKIEADVAVVKARMSKFLPIVHPVYPIDPAEDLMIPPTGIRPSPVPTTAPAEENDDTILAEDDEAAIRTVIMPVDKASDVIVPSLVDNVKGSMIEAVNSNVDQASAPKVVAVLTRPTNAKRTQQFTLEKACCGALALD
jgi:hypothetical protein